MNSLNAQLASPLHDADVRSPLNARETFTVTPPPSLYDLMIVGSDGQILSKKKYPTCIGAPCMEAPVTGVSSTRIFVPTSNDGWDVLDYAYSGWQLVKSNKKESPVGHHYNWGGMRPSRPSSFYSEVLAVVETGQTSCRYVTIGAEGIGVTHDYDLHNDPLWGQYPVFMIADWPEMVTVHAGRMIAFTATVKEPAPNNSVHNIVCVRQLNDGGEVIKHWEIRHYDDPTHQSIVMPVLQCGGTRLMSVMLDNDVWKSSDVAVLVYFTSSGKATAEVLCVGPQADNSGGWVGPRLFWTWDIRPGAPMLGSAVAQFPGSCKDALTGGGPRHYPVFSLGGTATSATCLGGGGLGHAVSGAIDPGYFVQAYQYELLAPDISNFFSLSLDGKRLNCYAVDGTIEGGSNASIYGVWRLPLSGSVGTFYAASMLRNGGVVCWGQFN